MAEELRVARLAIEPLPIPVWVGVSEAIAAALSKLGYDAYYRDGEIVARPRENP